MALSRRQLLRLASVGAAAWPLVPHLVDDTPADAANPPDPVGVLGTTSDPETLTLEAWADTLIPGRKRYSGDVAIAGVSSTAGAVQAGAIEFMRYGPVGAAPALPGFAAAIDAAATAYIAEHRPAGVDPTLPPFVGLRYPDRIGVLHNVLDPSNGEEQLLWFAIAGLVFLAYHTAGHLPTAQAVRDGHPGLAAIGFPHPDRDGLWRFPHFSYRRRLARRHPHTTRTGQPR